MATHSLELLLKDHPFSRDMTHQHRAKLSGCATNVRFASGEYLCRADTPADRAFLIRAGRVSFEIHGAAGGAVPIETAEEGELVGWSWLYPEHRWHFDAVASGPVRALLFDGECLRHKCEADPAFGFELVKRLLYQAHLRLERSRLQALDVFGQGKP